MRLKFDKTVIDLGFTPVENMFIHTYLSLADGNSIKVYLYALSHAYSTNQEDITNEIIAFEMGLTEGQVIDAWSYWQEKGLVEIKDETVIFKSLRDNYINQLMGFDPTNNDVEKEIIESSFDSSNPMESASKRLIEDIEDFISQGKDFRIPLKPNEIDMILNQVRDYNLTYDYFSFAFAMASVEVDSKNIPQLVGVIRNWVINGAVDEDSLNRLLEKKANDKKNKSETKSGERSKKTRLSDDDRMSKEERKRFIEEKMKKQDFRPRRD